MVGRRLVSVAMTMKSKFLVAAGVVGLSGMAAALADDVQFVTLPETVRTAVIRETRIPDVSRVTRVVRDENGLYEVTVRRESDNDVVFVDPYGRVGSRSEPTGKLSPRQLRKMLNIRRSTHLFVPWIPLGSS